MTAAAPDLRFRDHPAEADRHPEIRDALYRYLDAMSDYGDRGDIAGDFRELWDYVGPAIEARVQAAAAQRVVEEIGEALSIAATRSPLDAVAWMSRRAAVLAQPTEDAS